MRKLLAFGLLLAPTSALSWGIEGHSIIAEIAQREMSEQARRAVDELLDHGTLASISGWADDVKYTSRLETYAWHFVDIPLKEHAYSFDRDCKYQKNASAPVQKECLVTALTQLKSELRCGTSKAARLDALRFVVHLVGDATQPLHTVLEEMGGNNHTVTLKFCGLKDNKCDHVPSSVRLHFFWDTTVITETVYNWGTYVDHLYDPKDGWLLSTESKDHTVVGRTIEEWVHDTHAQADVVWTQMLSSTNEIDQTYYGKALKVLERQLGLGGLRLARFLDDAYSSNVCPMQ